MAGLLVFLDLWLFLTTKNHGQSFKCAKQNALTYAVSWVLTCFITSSTVISLSASSCVLRRNFVLGTFEKASFI